MTTQPLVCYSNTGQENHLRPLVGLSINSPNTDTRQRWDRTGSRNRSVGNTVHIYTPDDQEVSFFDSNVFGKNYSLPNDNLRYSNVYHY